MQASEENKCACAIMYIINYGICSHTHMCKMSARRVRLHMNDVTVDNTAEKIHSTVQKS